MMALQVANLDMLAAAQDAADTAMEAATLVVERLAEAMRASMDPEAKPARVTTTFRLKREHYELLRQLALEKHISQQALLDEALELLQRQGKP